jgi:hypothetical protein
MLVRPAIASGRFGDQVAAPVARPTRRARMRAQRHLQ